MTLAGFRVLRPSDFEPQLSAARQMLAEGADLETIWRFLREHGCDWGLSIYLTQLLTGMAHRDAKRAVYSSETWADFRPAIDHLHDSLEAAIAELEAAGEVEVRSTEQAAKSRPA